jgi:hypothetical protein
MAAMMPMIATTISSSISVKPFWLRTFMNVLLKKNGLAAGLGIRLSAYRLAQRPTPGIEQPGCHDCSDTGSSA